MIHLRYADNLRLTRHITYDGVHPDFGTSSLLYVGLLAFLSNFIHSPALPRCLSSLVHMGLFLGLAFFFARSAPRPSSLVRLLTLVVLFVLSVPSSVRWLDDGMETGLVMCFVAALCVLTFREATRNRITARSYLGFAILGFTIVMLRTELLLLCGLSSLILTVSSTASTDSPKDLKTYLKASLPSSHLVLGGLIAVGGIVWKMHVLLPDTALAKSHGIGIWCGILHATLAVTLGSMTFGAGMLLLWILTFVLVLRIRRVTLPTIIANAVFPLIVALACLRGQEIQGIRYLVWAMFFSVLWNIFELDRAATDAASAKQDTAGNVLIYALIVLLILVQPYEARAMYRVLHGRAKIMGQVEGQHLDVLANRMGIAGDVGIIGYFSKADICDINGLVNGREAARKTPREREAACAARNPGFLFVNHDQLTDLRPYISIGAWAVCADYNLPNVHSEDLHYLIVPATDAVQLCKAATGSEPYPATHLLPAEKPQL